MTGFEGYTWIKSSRGIILKVFMIYMSSKKVYEWIKQCEYVK